MRPKRAVRSLLHRPVAIGRTGDEKTLGQVLRIVTRLVVEDLASSPRHYYLVRFVGARLIPRPLRFVLLRLAGVRLQQSDIGAGLFLGGPPSHLTIGHGTSINVDCFFDCLGKVTLGDGVMVGMGVTIVTSDHPIGPDGRPQAQPVARDVVVGDRAWLGARSMLLPGVTVGEGTIVSAGAVVTRDCRPFSVYAGVPARLIGQVPTRGGEAPQSTS
jgi:acetyltransferase-like isoleucine patch superfamily enzyme